MRLQSQGSVLSDVDSDSERVPAGGLMTDPEALAAAAAPPAVLATNDAVVDLPKPRIPKVTSDSFISELVSDREGQVGRRDGPPTSGPSIPEEDDTAPATVEVGDADSKSPPALVLSPSQTSGVQGPQWSNVDLEEAQTHLAVGPPAESAETSSLSSVATYHLGLEELYGPDEHPLWAWVSGGGCDVDSHSQLNWFNSVGEAQVYKFERLQRVCVCVYMCVFKVSQTVIFVT